MMKKLSSIILALVMVLALVPAFEITAKAGTEQTTRITQQPSSVNEYEVTVDGAWKNNVTYQWMVMTYPEVELKNSGLVIDRSNNETGQIVTGENKINAEYVSWEAGQNYEAGSHYEIYFKLPEGTKRVTFTVDSLDGLFSTAEQRNFYGVTVEQNGSKWDCTYPYDPAYPYFYIWHDTQTFTISNVNFITEKPVTFPDTDNKLTGGESEKTYYCAISYTDSFTENSANVHFHDQAGVKVPFDTPITTKEELVSLFKNGGSGCLYKNIELNDTLKLDYGKEVSLCLNGYVINLSRKNILLLSDTSLKVYDCAQGKIKGTITNGQSATDGGAINVGIRSKLYLYGGIIDNSKAEQSGGGVFLSTSAVFCMYGGAIRNCTSKGGNGGAVNCEVGSFHMYGGTITGNWARISNTGSSGYGGGVHNGKSAASFHMHGGIITENHAERIGGGIYNQLDTTFDGKCIVKDNYSYGGKETTDANKAVDNLYTTNTVTIGAGGSTEEYAGKGILLNGSEIGVTLPGVTGAVTKSNGTTDFSKYFASDNPDYGALNDKTDAENQFVKIGQAYLVTEATCTNGSVSVGKRKKYSEGNEVSISNTPSEGYELDTYSVYKTGDPQTIITVKDGKFTMPDYAVTVSATFKEKPKPVVIMYKVTFDVQGQGKAPDVQEIEKDGTVKKPEDPTAEGYTFGGWFKETECKNTWDFSNDTVTKDTTLYAKWTKNGTDKPTTGDTNNPMLYIILSNLALLSLTILFLLKIKPQKK